MPEAGGASVPCAGRSGAILYPCHDARREKLDNGGFSAPAHANSSGASWKSRSTISTTSAWRPSSTTSVISDQPIRYKGDGSAPGPFDYFLASSAMCAAYFVKVYCNARDIPTENIRLSQNNIVDPENRYKQIFKIQVELPEDISDKDRQGILRSIDRCTVKRVVQEGPDFQIEVVENLDEDV